MHLSASIGTGKAPMELASMDIALGGQDHTVLPQLLEALDALRQTAALKDADLDLCHIQPFERVMHLQSLPDALHFLRSKRLVKASRRMRVGVVHHQASNARLGIDLIDELAYCLGKIKLGVLLSHLYTALSSQWFDEHKQVRCPQALVLLIEAVCGARLHWQRLHAPPTASRQNRQTALWYHKELEMFVINHPVASVMLYILMSLNHSIR